MKNNLEFIKINTIFAVREKDLFYNFNLSIYF